MKTVLCHGVFDLLHEGHLEHLEQARAFGDRLVVSVVADKYVTKRNVFYAEDARTRLVAGLRCVDEVLLCKDYGPQAIIKIVRPDIYVRGSDYVQKHADTPEAELLEGLGIEIRFTKSIQPRTSDIVELLKSEWSIKV